MDAVERGQFHDFMQTRRLPPSSSARNRFQLIPVRSTTTRRESRCLRRKATIRFANASAMDRSRGSAIGLPPERRAEGVDAH